MARDTKNTIPAKPAAPKPAEGIDFGDESEAPAVVSGKGPHLIALTTIIGVPGQDPTIRRHQRFYCPATPERERLIRVGAARVASEVDAERKKIIVPE